LKILKTGRLRSSILSNDISNVGKFQIVERRVNLNADDKRMWFEELRNVNDRVMIDSLSISLNYF